jgi:hypothetical protein
MFGYTGQISCCVYEPLEWSASVLQSLAGIQSSAGAK